MTRTRLARVAILVVLAAAAMSAVGTTTASADAVGRYCDFCTMSAQSWDAHSGDGHTWDTNTAWDCSITNCGSWYTCVSMHVGSGSELLLPRECSSSGYVKQGYDIPKNWNTRAATAWCYNGSSSAHHMLCEARAISSY